MREALCTPSKEQNEFRMQQNKKKNSVEQRIALRAVGLHRQQKA
jgi:hypothetical protein